MYRCKGDPLPNCNPPTSIRTRHVGRFFPLSTDFVQKEKEMYLVLAILLVSVVCLLTRADEPPDILAQVAPPRSEHWRQQWLTGDLWQQAAIGVMSWYIMQ